MPRVVVPPLNELTSLRQPLTDGERRVLDWFVEILPSGWEIYIQPHMNGLRPDFVLLHPQNGIAVYEVKDWSLRGMDYFVKDTKLMGRKDGKVFALRSHDPIAKIDQYKQEIFDLYVPSLPTNSGFGAIVAGIIFTNADTKEVEGLLEPLREARGHTKYPRLYPLIGRELVGDRSDHALRTLLSSVRKYDDRMNERVAAELRHWLVEPSFSTEQRVPLAKLMNKRQRSLALNEDGVSFRRIKGPAGSGKSLVLAARAAELAKAGRRVLVVTFNITLTNYLLDLAVQYAQSGKVRKQVTALNFHFWCKRVAFLSGRMDEYNELWGDGEEGDAKEVLETELPVRTARWATELDEANRWDAVLVDEGQDFHPSWWSALRAAMTREAGGEALIVADAQQNVYGVKPWTESEMTGAGFRGRWATLDSSYRMSPALCRLASAYVERFIPDAEEHRPVPPEGEFEFKTVLRWIQIDSDNRPAEVCMDSILGILPSSAADPVSVSDLVCIVDREDVGLELVQMLRERKIRTIHTFGQGKDEREKREDGRRKKLVFYKGDARVKVTTIQSFKGWESRALVVQISSATDSKGCALAYAGITRLKRDDHGCYLTVVCAAPELHEYGEAWPQG
jgi:hypothetical protein